NYEQRLLIIPNRAATYLRLAELLLAPLKQSERAVSILTEGRRRYPEAPEFAYYLAIALRESKKAKEAVVMFEEALNEAQNAQADLLKPRFYVEYGAAAEEASLYDKAAELFHKAIAMDPANAAEPYNYLGYIYSKLNRVYQALESWQKAKTLDPSNKNLAAKIDAQKTRVSKTNPTGAKP